MDAQQLMQLERAAVEVMVSCLLPKSCFPNINYFGGVVGRGSKYFSVFFSLRRTPFQQRRGKRLKRYSLTYGSLSCLTKLASIS